MLSSAFPALCSATPGEIQEERLPDLKHLVVFDDSAASVSGSAGKFYFGTRMDEKQKQFKFTSGTTAIVSTLVEEKCTALHGVPTHFLGVLSEVEERRKSGQGLDLSRLRTGIAAGTSMPIDLMKQLMAKMNLTDLTVAYGMTETSPVSFQTTPVDSVVHRVETVGKVHPHVRAKIVDNDGNIVPVHTPGELLVAGYLVQEGYWNDAEQTASVMKTDEDGTLWMYTGDEGVMDEDGYLRIVGRIKDIILRGGENLFPVQIENVLTDHPSIREAATVAVPDAKYGEVVGAWIVLEPNSQMSREDVRQVVWEECTGMGMVCRAEDELGFRDSSPVAEQEKGSPDVDVDEYEDHGDADVEEGRRNAPGTQSGPSGRWRKRDVDVKSAEPLGLEQTDEHRLRKTLNSHM
ncbi:hypothetical protein EUX98_g3979 [Antrodiella citrinella]|uniref:AMP-dependent synthetase/ligase domain-containing protein n=1 Tax=Antrodiella citrinella TaxID=2447956 RepID=A0A4S4MV68_9APHY|nr:hypothetical protein EUX98_g3979 [Antrodiella citrinella]